MFGSGGDSSAKHTVKTIMSGKQAQFPATGQTTASYYTNLGSGLVGTPINVAERNINIDSMLIADTHLSDFNDAMSHFEVRGEWARQLGEALAKKGDEQLFQVAILTSRAAATVTGLPSGEQVTAANSKTDGDVLGSAIFDSGQVLDEHNIDESPRYSAFRPAQYNLLAQTTRFLDVDYGKMQGDISMGMVGMIDNIMVMKSNNIPITNLGVIEENGVENTYVGDFSNTTGIVWHKSAFGTVRLVGLSTQAETSVRYQGTLIVARYAMGHGILMPESAVEIKTA